jgi:hypothetical protein
MITIELTKAEADLLVEALQSRASRHDSMARANPRSAMPHERISVSMHRLAGRILMATEVRTGLRR